MGRLGVWLWYAALALLLVSCGGGGGGDSGPGRPTLTASTTSLTFTATQGGPTPAAQNIGLSASGGGVFVVQPVFTSPIASAFFTITGTASGNVAVIPFSPAVMAPGTYTGTITIRACGDLVCASGDVAGSPLVIQVSYTIQPATGLRGAPPSLTFSQLQGGTAPSAQTLGLSAADGSSYAWNASIIYQSGSGWLTLNGAGSASGASLPTSLPVAVNSTSTLGTLNAIVRVTGNGSTLDVPVSYAVTEATLGRSTSVMTFAAANGGSLPANQQVTLFTSSSLPVGYTTNVVYGAGASGWLSVPASGTAPDTVNVGVNTTSLGIGSYTATVSFTTPGGQSTFVDVTYNVGAAALTFSPSSVSFTINTSSTASALSQTVSVGSTSGTLAWTASSNQPWVTVSPSSGSSGSTVTLILDAAQLDTLDPTFHSASITFTYTPPGGTQITSAVPVQLLLTIPKVTAVFPYVATSGTSLPVSLAGLGLNNLGLGNIKFGSTAVSYLTPSSVTPPALSAGRYRISFENQLGNPSIVRSTADLVVVDAPGFAATTIAYPNATAKQALRIVYDAERRAILVGAAYPSEGMNGDLFRYTLSGSTWSATSVAVNQFRDLALALDGSKVIALGSSSITPYDPVTLAAGTATPAPSGFAPFFYFRRLALTQDGNAIVTTGVNGSGFTQAYKYSVSDGALSPTTSFFSFGSVGAGADGSLALIIQSGVSPEQNLVRYTPSNSTFSTVNVALGQLLADPVLNRRATRILLNGNLVYDASFGLLGKIPGSTAVALSPDGLKAYAYSGGTTLHTYDLSGTLANPSTDQFPEIGTGTTLAGDAGISSVMTISPDGGTLFIAGSDAIVVQPAPP